MWQVRYIFFAQFNNNSNNKKNCPTHRFNLTQSDPCELSWVGLDVMDLVGLDFF